MRIWRDVDWSIRLPRRRYVALHVARNGYWLGHRFVGRVIVVGIGTGVLFSERRSRWTWRRLSIPTGLR